jgi:competence protein ComEC
MPRRLAFAQLSVREQPLVFLAVAFVLGELAASRFPLFNLKFWLGAVVGLLGSAVLLVCLRQFKWQRDAIITVLLGLSCFGCGGLFWSLNEASVAEQRIKKLFERGVIAAAEPVEIWGTIKAAPELAPDRIYLDVAIERIATLGKEQLASGIVRLVVPFAEGEDRADYDALQLAYGVRLRVLTNLRKAQGYRNPGAPNFDEMLEHRGYDATGLIKSPLLIERIGGGSRNLILNFLYSVRANAIAVILRSFTQPTAGILVAALFGNQHFLAHDTAESFRIGGTFHLLVISGLHVAMLALVISWLAAKVFKSRVLRFGVVMLLLWAYALMVGAQPAITRATVMLTFVLVGQLIFRTAPGANTLAAATFVLLAWQPRDLFNPAFQLSFLTVAMIVTVTVPLLARLKELGAWQPSALTPYPPRVPAWLKRCAEVLHWNEAEFQEEMRKAPIHYRLEKARTARWLSTTRVRRWGQQSLRWTTTTIIATIAVQVGLLPIMVMYFHRISFVAPLMNALQGALMFVLMMVGAAYLLLYALVGSFVMKLAFMVNGIGWLMAYIADKLLGWRRLNFRVPDYGETSGWIYASYFVCILLLLIALNCWNPFSLRPAKRQEAARDSFLQSRRVFTASLFITSGLLLVLLVLLVWHPQQHEFEPGRLSITFLDVGQGDGMLVSFPNSKLMLLDSGGRTPIELSQTEGEEIFIEDHLGVGEAAVAPYLWRRGIKRLDYIVASHGHSDHTQGFADIGKGFAIGTALTGIIPTEDKQFDSFRQAAAYAGAPLQALKRGASWEVDGVKLDVLAPFQDALNAAQAANNQSLVLRLRYGQRTFLLTGDIEKETEARLVEANEDLKTDVLKVAHHGSRSSSTPAFLARAKPVYAVISVAHPSPFDHPHPETMTGLQRIGAHILQTSRCGAITISTDGNDLQVKTFVKCE